MPHVQTPSLRLYYELEGDPAAPPLVLIAGQGAQLTSWHPELRHLLIEQGFQLILFDNRDVGLSTKWQSGSHYEISDMANDVAELLDALEIDAAHVVGQSMGGMVAQQLTIDHPMRVLSLCSIYSAPSIEHLGDDPEVWAIREQEPATERESAIAQYIERESLCGLAEYTPEWIRAHAEATYDRCYCPEGADRQMAAVRSSPDRTLGLRQVNVPTAVLHGLADRLIDTSGGYATALAVPGAELHTYADMGHQLVPSLFGDYVRVITRNISRAQERVHTHA
ncbi:MULTISPECIES: alpha/beta fold hydrolase [Nocardioides]|uniref:Alpha/beta fold hydrolase n=1 Tax=Nocardioides vastitatis TaxID=2568655 RepID=A0ABW0ZEL4_9ACTN|nr:alpha/beta fold hydrolase [Nocardioides sp.]